MNTCFMDIDDSAGWIFNGANFNDATNDKKAQAYVSFVFDDTGGKCNEICVVSSTPSGVIASLNSMIAALTEGREKMSRIEKEVLAEEAENNE